MAVIDSNRLPQILRNFINGVNPAQYGRVLESQQIYWEGTGSGTGLIAIPDLIPAAENEILLVDIRMLSDWPVSAGGSPISFQVGVYDSFTASGSTAVRGTGKIIIPFGIRTAGADYAVSKPTISVDPLKVQAYLQRVKI